MTKIGELRHRVAIQARASGSDSYGQPNGVWEDIYPNSRSAKVESAKGSERVRGEQIEATVSSVVVIRYPRRGQIPTPKMRVVHDGRTLEIAAVEDKTGKKRFLHLFCTEQA